MSFRYAGYCPIARATQVLGERWTILIMRELVLGTTRFNDFQRALSQISPTLLTKRLNELQECGLLVRKNVPGKRRVEYHPTAAGKELEPIILGLGEWGMRWTQSEMNDDELDVETLMYDLHRRIDINQLPGGRTVIKFNFRNLPKFAHWWIVLEGGKSELCVQNPGTPVDLDLTTNLPTMVRIFSGDLEMRAAREAGRLELKGNPVLIRTISSWLRPGIFAHIKPQTEPAPRRSLGKSAQRNKG